MEASFLLFSLIESQGEGVRQKDIQMSGRRGRLELVTRGRRGRGISATRGIRGVSSVSDIFSAGSPVVTGSGEELVAAKRQKKRGRNVSGKSGGSGGDWAMLTTPLQEGEEVELVGLFDSATLTPHLPGESAGDVTLLRSVSGDLTENLP